MQSDWPGMRRYVQMLAAARSRGEVPAYLPLKTGKPLCVETLLELIEAGKLTPRQIRDLWARIGRGKQDRSSSPPPPKATAVPPPTSIDHLRLMAQQEWRRRTAEAYRVTERAAAIPSAGVGV